ncbi:MAG: macro domain-containing protein [Candidatus Brocadiae bacterium]|nr:macro domain-containing protein [Candidatus Brocadiia bacterium]
MRVRIFESELELVTGDITEQDVEAIVNPANRLLKLGAGVAGAIARKGGPMIQRECDAIGGCDVGSAVITGSGELPCRFVIHAVGPKMGEGEEDEKLASCVDAVFDLCAKNSIQTVAFPAVSTGVYGVPADLCANAMLSATIRRLKGEGAPGRVIYCLFDLATLTEFETALGELWKGR